MTDANVKTTFGQADELFEAAQNELFKPEEDVVSYMVCSNSYKAIKKYLAAYLIEKGEPVEESTELDVLLDRCRKMDTKFNNLILDSLYNRSEDEDVWMDIETAKEFMDKAVKTKNIIKE